MGPPSIPRCLRSVIGVAVVCAVAALPKDAFAHDVLQRFSLRGEFGAGLMLPSVQRQVLGYDSAQVQVTARVGFDVLDWFSLQVSVNNGFFLASGQRPTGRTLALQFGLRLQPAIGTVGRVWGDVNPGYYSTGTDRRFGLDAGLGFEFALGRALALGPFARVHWLPADEAIHAASDPVYVTFGLSLALRVPRPLTSATPTVADRDADGVLDADDQCPAVSQGQRPDASRRGCPALDMDGDGVLDVQDACANVPAGEHADPARVGCPLVDRDGDTVADQDDQCPTEPQGVRPDDARRGCPLRDQDGDTIVDGEDQCPTVPQGARADATRRGCPVGDRDEDGIVDTADRCPDRAETFNGREDEDGCPDGRALGERGGGRIRISEQIRFRTDSAEIRGRRSFMILDAIAAILRVAPDITMLHVEGHTDDQGEPAHNRELSMQRAQQVIQQLVSRGIATTRLTAHGFGAERPLAQGRSSRVRAANRRIEFRVDLGNDAAAPASGGAPMAR